MKNSETSKYTISYTGLDVGIHQLNYTLDDSFFVELSNSEIDKGNVEVSLELEKKSNMLVFGLKWKGKVNVMCDRCADMISLAVKGSQKMHVKFGTKPVEDLDDVIFVPLNESKINIAQHLYEYILLSIPVRNVHGKDKEGNSLCNKDAIKVLNDLLLTEEDEKKSDPRWDALKELINKN